MPPEAGAAGHGLGRGGFSLSDLLRLGITTFRSRSCLQAWCHARSGGDVGGAPGCNGSVTIRRQFMQSVADHVGIRQ